ncbi:predicted protein [Uncinocarpus reesii 1704]|uniref:Uncharacterized protein n=1 Tax=Uncinocarpus reesii (strain UAMH 1704) TaxID=336963 RepID=C4JDV9_UNCRE|nr:uncharacterized protein UREG_00586 [Uncinocarpus reesii 1704]EEP75739.1 predicted protein [Uncinocarpus reesii 1704]
MPNILHLLRARNLLVLKKRPLLEQRRKWQILFRRPSQEMLLVTEIGVKALDLGLLAAPQESFGVPVQIRTRAVSSNKPCFSGSVKPWSPKGNNVKKAVSKTRIIVSIFPFLGGERDWKDSGSRVIFIVQTAQGNKMAGSVEGGPQPPISLTAGPEPTAGHWSFSPAEKEQENSDLVWREVLV